MAIDMESNYDFSNSIPNSYRKRINKMDSLGNLTKHSTPKVRELLKTSPTIEIINPFYENSEESVASKITDYFPLNGFIYLYEEDGALKSIASGASKLKD